MQVRPAPDPWSDTFSDMSWTSADVTGWAEACDDSDMLTWAASPSTPTANTSIFTVNLLHGYGLRCDEVVVARRADRAPERCRAGAGSLVGGRAPTAWVTHRWRLLPCGITRRLGAGRRRG